MSLYILSKTYKVKITNFILFMSKDLKNLIDTVEEKESSHSELEQEVKILKEDIKRLNFTISEQKLLISEQTNKLQKSEIYELPGDIRILKDMLVSQRLEIKKRDKDVDILEQEIEKLTTQVKSSKNKRGDPALNEELIKNKKLIVQLTEENEKYRADKDESENLFKKLMEENEEYLLQIDTLKDENQNLDVEISKDSSIKLELEGLENNSNIVESLKLEVENLKNEAIQLKQKLKSSDSTHDKSEMEFEEVNELSNDFRQLIKLKRDFNTAKITIDNLVEEINKHLKEITEQDKEIRDKNTKISVLNEKIEGLNRRNKKIQEQIEDTQLQPTADDSYIEFSESLLKELQEENKILNQRILELEETEISHPRDLDVYDINELKELINYLKNENQQLKKSIIELKENKFAPLSKAIESDEPYNELIEMNKNLILENETLANKILKLKEIKSLPTKDLSYNYKFDHSTPQYYQTLFFMKILNTLDKYKREIVIDSLIQDLGRTSNLDIKRFIINLISEIKDERRIRDTLIQMISSDDWLIRLHLVKALSKFDNADDIKRTLEELLGDADLDVRNAAKEALRKIS